MNHKTSKLSRSISILTVLAILIVLVASMLTRPALAAGETVSVWVTTGDQSKLLQQQANLTFAADSGSNPLTIDINEATTYQQMDGFGASFSDSSAWLVWNKLSAAQRTTLMNDLFNPSTGIGLSYLRQPIGTSDFALSNFTYDDMPAGQTDPNLNNFSIAHDTAYIIPVVKQAMSINPSIKVMISPWSAPAWMKSNQSLSNGGSLNASAYGPYANYFVKTIQAYAAQGVAIDALTIQNEPQFAPAYPGMLMSATEQANFIKNNLGPALVNAGLTTKIVAFDHNWDTPQYPQTVLADAAASAYIDGTAWHCYAGTPDAQNTIHNAYPNKNIYFTECSGGAWAPAFAGNLQWDMQNLVIGSTRNWSKTVVKWNMVLDTNSGPTNGGCTNCRGVVTINQANGAVTREVEYYVLGHASKFVVPGAYRIASNTYGAGSIENVAFKNPDGSKVAIVLNSGTVSNTFKLRWAGQSVSYTLPAGAVATFKWATCAGCPTPTLAPPTATPTITLTPTKTNTPTPLVAFNQIEAENFAVNSGLQIETTTDIGGGSVIGWADSGDYLKFNRVDFGTGAASVQGRMASTSAIGRIEFHLDSTTGPLIGTLNFTNTGDWQTWVTNTASISGASGIHDLYLVYQGGAALGNFNWFKFSTGAIATATRTNTPIPPTATRTNTPVGPTPTRTNTSIAPTVTRTATPASGPVYYTVTARHSGKLLDVQNVSSTDGALMEQWAATGGTNQQFQFVPISGTSYFQIIARNSGKCMDVQNGSNANGALIQQWTCDANNINQHFSLQTVSGTSFINIISRLSNKCFDVQNVSTSDGALIQQWTCGTGTNQQWTRTIVP